MAADMLDLRTPSQRAYSRGYAATAPRAARLTRAQRSEARRLLREALATAEAAGDAEAAWQTKGAQRALHDAEEA